MAGGFVVGLTAGGFWGAIRGQGYLAGLAGRLRFAAWILLQAFGLSSLLIVSGRVKLKPEAGPASTDPRQTRMDTKAATKRAQVSHPRSHPERPSTCRMPMEMA